MNNEQQSIQDLQSQLKRFQTDLDSLSQNFYKNNFSSSQVFNKDCEFTTKLKVPGYTVLPLCEVGEIAESGGKLYICSTANNWALVGGQV